MQDLRFVEGNLENAEVVALLELHLRGMAEITPAEFIFALSIDGLKAKDVRFWSAWHDEGEDGENLLGCGAMRELADASCEIKSMRTATPYLRRGVGQAILQFILAQAAERGLTRAYLETGSQAGFAAARQLYEANGFTYCGAFADYEDNPTSVFMLKALGGLGQGWLECC